MNHLLKARGLEQQVICDSAGTSGYHIDAKPDRRMNAAAERKLGLTLTGRSRKFGAIDFDDFDLILAMDQTRKQWLLHKINKTSKINPLELLSARGKFVRFFFRFSFLLTLFLVVAKKQKKRREFKSYF